MKFISTLVLTVSLLTFSESRIRDIVKGTVISLKKTGLKREYKTESVYVRPIFSMNNFPHLRMKKRGKRVMEENQPQDAQPQDSAEKNAGDATANADTAVDTAADGAKPSDDPVIVNEEKIRNYGVFNVQIVDYERLFKEAQLAEEMDKSTSNAGATPAEETKSEDSTKADAQPADPQPQDNAKKALLISNSKGLNIQKTFHSSKKAATATKENTGTAEDSKAAETPKQDPTEGETPNTTTETPASSSKPFILFGDTNILQLPLLCKKRLEGDELVAVAARSKFFLDSWKEASGSLDAPFDNLPPLNADQYAQFYAKVTEGLPTPIEGYIKPEQAVDKKDDLVYITNFANTELKTVGWLEFWIYMCNAGIEPFENEYKAEKPNDSSRFDQVLEKLLKDNELISSTFSQIGRQRNRKSKKIYDISNPNHLNTAKKAGNVYKEAPFKKSKKMALSSDSGPTIVNIYNGKRKINMKNN